MVTPGHRLKGMDSCLDLLWGKSKEVPDVGTCERIVHHMFARNRDVSLDGGLRKVSTCRKLDGAERPF